MSSVLLEVDDVCVHFPVRTGILQRPSAWVKAVDGVSLTVDIGDTIGLVGESGCGKTTLSNAITMLEPLTRGRITFDGHDLSRLGRRGRTKTRRSIQIVFQDPYWSLDPRWLVRDIVGEPAKTHLHLHAREHQRLIVDALERVGMSEKDMFKYPFEFSGGVRQRLAIARALILEPKMVILDEPTSAIDVLSQYQILLMLQDLKEQLDLTYILVSHDLSVVGYLATKIGVMYAGRIVEWGPVEEVFATTLHPYTRALLAAVPDPQADGGELAALPGEVASAVNPPSGCRFHPRCSEAMDKCRSEQPPQFYDGESGHSAFCWLLE
jgi:oligopeptide/dipeptide ABC transporter ATP-binding protein